MSRKLQLEHLMQYYSEKLLRIAYYYTKNAQSAGDSKPKEKEYA
ncbi:hypothetical protein NYE67_06890 [Solibacillus sp. FSL W8-0474]